MTPNDPGWGGGEAVSVGTGFTGFVSVGDGSGVGIDSVGGIEGVGKARLICDGNTVLVLSAPVGSVPAGVSVAGYLQADSRTASRRMGTARRR